MSKQTRRYNLLLIIVIYISIIFNIFAIYTYIRDILENLYALKYLGAESIFFFIPPIATLIWVAGLVYILYYKKLGFDLCILSAVINFIGAVAFTLISPEISMMIFVSPIVSFGIFCLWMLTTKNGYNAFEVLFKNANSEIADQSTDIM